MGNFENNIDNHNNGAVDVDRYNGICADDDADDENVTMKKAERLRRSLLPALSITTAAKKVATIWEDDHDHDDYDDGDDYVPKFLFTWTAPMMILAVVGLSPLCAAYN